MRSIDKKLYARRRKKKLQEDAKQLAIEAKQFSSRNRASVNLAYRHAMRVCEGAVGMTLSWNLGVGGHVRGLHPIRYLNIVETFPTRDGIFVHLTCLTDGGTLSIHTHPIDCFERMLSTTLAQQRATGAEWANVGAQDSCQNAQVGPG